MPLLLDIDGDRRDEISVFRPSNGTWYILLSTSGYNLARTVQWGLANDVPVPADYDGDGLSDIAVWRPATGTWYVMLSSGSGRPGALQANAGDLLSRQWGLGSYKPIGGMDADGDGRSDLTVWDPSTGVWFVLFSSGGYNRDQALQLNTSTGSVAQWGLPGDIPEKGDFDGDGKDDLAVWRSGLWYIKYSSGAPTVPVQWGLPSDIPGVIEPNDDSSERRAGFTVYRSAEGNHYERRPTGVATVTQWGLSGDVPVGYSDNGLVHN